MIHLNSKSWPWNCYCGTIHYCDKLGEKRLGERKERGSEEPLHQQSFMLANDNILSKNETFLKQTNKKTPPFPKPT